MDADPVEQPGLFGDLEAKPVTPLKQSASPSKAKVTYKPCTLVGAKCQDCAEVVYDGLQEGRVPGDAIRRARVRRIQGKHSRLLCTEHANHRREQDPPPPARS